MDDPVPTTGIKPGDPDLHALVPNRGEQISKPNQVSTVVLYGIPIVSLVIEAQERLCLAQISNTLLKQFSYNEIHNRRVALGITCVQCTPVQLEILRRAGAMPVSSRRCGMITRREAERLCKSFLGDNAPPRLPDDFAFTVHHECAWGCRGSFLPARYNSSRAKCIKCAMCGLFFSPNKFIFHSHRLSAADKYVQPDAANFNSWRRHMKLSGSPPEEITHAWEDVKAMFNGGTRKRLLTSACMPRGNGATSGGGGSAKHQKLSEGVPSSHQASVQSHGSVGLPSSMRGGSGGSGPIIPAPRIPSGCHQDISLPISRVAMDFIYNKPFAFSSYGNFPWLKRSPILFPSTSAAAAAAAAAAVAENSAFFPPLEKSYHQSAFRPVQQPLLAAPLDEEVSEGLLSTTSSGASILQPHKEEHTDEDDDDDDVDIETTDEKTDIGAIVEVEPATEESASTVSTTTVARWSPHQDVALTQSSLEPAGTPPDQTSTSITDQPHPSFPAQPELLPSLTHRIWNISKLSFDGTNRANFLYRQDLHRHFFLASDGSTMPRSPLSLSKGPPTLDCSTCINQQNSHFSTTDTNNKITQ